MQQQPTQPRQLSEFEIGFVMGLIAGEGHFGTNRHGNTPVPTLYVQIGMVAEDRVLLEYTRGLIGGSLYDRPPQGDNRQPQVVLLVRRGSEVQRLAQLCLLHMPPSKKRRQLEAWIGQRSAAWLRGEADGRAHGVRQRRRAA